METSPSLVFFIGVEDAAGEGAGSGRSSGEQRHRPLKEKNWSSWTPFSLITVDFFLQNVEAAFADVHRKYERTKQVAGSRNLSWSPLYYDF